MHTPTPHDVSLIQTAFPFLLTLDRELRIVECGAALSRIVPACRAGRSLTEVFRLRRPNLMPDFDRLREHHNTLFVLETTHHPTLVLRGQWLYDAARDSVLFIGLPWITNSKQLSELGLTLADFPLWDPTMDWLLLLESSHASLADAARLSERLCLQKDELKTANVALEALNAQLRKAMTERTAVNQRLQNMQQQLREANEALEERVRQRTAALLQSETRYHTLVDLIPDAILCIHADGHTIFANAAAASMFGAGSYTELIGTSIIDRVAPVDHDKLREYIHQVMERRDGTPPLEIQVLQLDGNPMEIELVGLGVPLYNQPSVLVMARDVTEQRRLRAELEYQATHDPLTDLPNRMLFNDRLAQAIRHADRYGGRLAVMLVDLDQFKVINDSLGHGAGDAVLRAIGQRLQGRARDCDTVARLGGDEFAVLADDSVSRESAPPSLAQRMIQAVAEPVAVDGHGYQITCSVGISIFPQDGTTAESLLQRADIAMFRAKETGRNTYCFFTPQMQADLNTRLSLEQQLQHALRRGEFVLHFQPKADLRTGRLVGIEALIRWNSPEHGLVPPGRFIPVAQESDLILEIGEWVLRAACTSVKAWEARGLPVVPIAVNVALPQFSLQQIEALIQHTLDSSGLDPSHLELELTESLAMHDPEKSIVQMHRLKETGVMLTIDDFGTGYSNLGYLKRFPIDKLKIHQSFVCELAHSPEDLAITIAIIRMAHSLGLRVVAEGVETKGQLCILAREGCDEIQGYHFSRPLPEHEITAMLERSQQMAIPSTRSQDAQRALLIVGGDMQVLDALKRAARTDSLQVLTTADPGDAYELLACHEVQAVVCDQRIAGENGIAFLGRLKRLYPRTARILLTEHSAYPPTRQGSAPPEEAIYDLSAPACAVQQHADRCDAQADGGLYTLITIPRNDAEAREVLHRAFNR